MSRMLRYNAEDDPGYLYIGIDGGGVWLSVAQVPALISELTEWQARMNLDTEES